MFSSTIDISFPKHFILNFYVTIKKDISCPEAVKLDEIDSAAVAKGYEAAKARFSSAEAGSAAQAEAQIEMEVNRSLGVAVGLSLA